MTEAESPACASSEWCQSVKRVKGKEGSGTAQEDSPLITTERGGAERQAADDFLFLT